MERIDKKTIERLYLGEKLSAIEIGDRLKISHWQLYKLMNKFQIQRRNGKEQNRIRFDKKELSFSYIGKLPFQQEKLKIAGLMLYWAEGHKDKRGCTLDLANSDPELIKLYLKFLRQIFKIDEKRLRVYLYCYSNQDIDELISYWSALTCITSERFTKPYVRKDYDENNPRKMMHGLVHVRYSDKKLHHLVMTMLNEVKRNMLE